MERCPLRGAQHPQLAPARGPRADASVKESTVPLPSPLPLPHHAKARPRLAGAKAPRARARLAKLEGRYRRLFRVPVWGNGCVPMWTEGGCFVDAARKRGRHGQWSVARDSWWSRSGGPVGLHQELLGGRGIVSVVEAVRRGRKRQRGVRKRVHLRVRPHQHFRLPRWMSLPHLLRGYG